MIIPVETDEEGHSHVGSVLRSAFCPCSLHAKLCEVSGVMKCNSVVGGTYRFSVSSKCGVQGPLCSETFTQRRKKFSGSVFCSRDEVKWRF
jgi:hypothetical protein